MDLDLRKVRYFVAVAEHESFVRAAEALHIAQPVLSRQIRSLEADLKVTLFDRGTRGTRLTEAGEAMLEEALGLLAAARAARRRVRDVAAGLRRFTVGFTPGVSIAPAVREFSARHPEVLVEVVRMDYPHRADFVRDGKVDVGYLRLPVGTHGLSTEPLFTEPLVVELPAGHRLAQRERVHIAELAAERLLIDDVPGRRDDSPASTGFAAPPASPASRGLTASAASPEEHAGPPVPGARNIEELLEHVAAGRGVVVVPLSTALYFARPDITHVLVDGLAPSHVCLAWRSSRRGALVTEYAGIARRTAGRA
ncbi:LysR family transcriptional regulator [Streptomyces sp. NRRL S-340]|uniref:LysR family transcriptional regulator n=1 Tax=Streptomyces sp. NRRL S-340 TaxID=1463901 RepID=UPI000564B1F8|nr:LysR substrate-binding domain-containing protein [Streptomyces sp. NRRL S-340]